MDFLFRIGLYLSPSHMALHPGNVLGHNNEIIIAGSERSYWPQPRNKTHSKVKSSHRPGLFRGGLRVLHRMLRKSPVKARAHEEEKPAFVTDGITLGQVALWLGGGGLASPELLREVGSHSNGHGSQIICKPSCSLS